MNVSELVEKYPVEIDGQITFAGILSRYFVSIGARWGKTTQENYLRDYKRNILPFFNDKPLSEYDKEYCEKVIEKINKDKQYSENTLAHYRLLIRKVYEEAERQNHSGNILVGIKGYRRKKDEDLHEIAVEMKLKVVKYFTPEQEILIYRSLCSDYKQDGAQMGLALMFISGARNLEACAICYEDVVKLDGKYYLCIINSYDEATGELKLGSKTDNSYRYFPISEKVYVFLMKRKAWLQQLVDEGKIKLNSKKIKSVDQMTIACDGDNYLKYCTPSKLTSAGRKLFRDLSISPAVISAIYEDMKAECNDPVFGHYKDPTAYSFRRSLAGHLLILGCTTVQCRYLMGHALESELVERGHFSNHDELNNLSQKLANRPLVNDVPFYGINKRKTEDELLLQDVMRAKVVIPTLGKEGRTLEIRILPHVPHQEGEYRISLNSEKASDIHLTATVQQKRRLETGKNEKSDLEVITLYDYWAPYFNI